jgi:uncharacterized protein with FMN-binding domain
VQDNRKSQKTFASVAILFVIALLAVGEVTYAHRKMTPNTGMATVAISKPATSTQTSTTTSSAASTGGFKDGTYKATGSYSSPGGQESITVSLTLKSGVISAATAKSGANDLTAQEYQMSFIQGYKALVVGKNISDVKLSAVSGSSLTSQGFNSAVQKIETEAKA